MKLIEHTARWVVGEVFQGKIMVTIGVILLVTFIAILRSESPILKGVLIPLALMALIQMGYGGFQLFSRPAHVSKVENTCKLDEDQALTQEYEKAVKDDKIYSRFKLVWASLIIVSVLLYFLFSTDERSSRTSGSDPR